MPLKADHRHLTIGVRRKVRRAYVVGGAQIFVVVVMIRVKLLTPVDDRVLVRLVDLHLVQQVRLGHNELQTVPDKDGHVFRCAGQILEIRNVLIQVEMIQLLHNRLVHVFLQIGDVHDHPGFGINRTPDGDLDCIIVTMPIRIIALSIHLSIGFLAEKWAMQTMTSTKTLLSREIH